MRRFSGPRASRGVLINASLFARGVRRGLALVAAAALLNVAGVAAAARVTAGQVTAAAGLTVDGSPAAAGQTLFPGSAFGTAERSPAALALDNRARLELSGGTSLRLDFDASNVGGSLEAGGARVYAPRGVAATFVTADASVVSDAADGPALFGVQVSEDGTTLTVQEGRVEMRAGGRSLTAAAGQTLRAAHGSGPEPAPPQGQSSSGKKKAGLFVGIAAALAAVIIIVAGQGDDAFTPPEIPCPIPGVSPVFPPPPGCTF
ncbi:MAG TPA: hypothetical protein VF659_07915 [Pyrinomonadaceae bacterium]|jgi:ferric-dicitrate binding protein FerR (iron transport regulator)